MKDLREYLKEFKGKFFGDYVEVNEPIDQGKHETAAYLYLQEENGRFPVTLFKKTKDLKGGDSKFPILHNVFATRQYIAMAVGMEPSNYRMELATHMGELQKKPVNYDVIT